MVVFGDQAVVAVGWWVITDEQAESGGTAGGGLDVVAGELPALAGEFVDVWAVDVFVSIARKLGVQVVNTDEQDVGFYRGLHSSPRLCRGTVVRRRGSRRGKIQEASSYANATADKRWKTGEWSFHED